MKLIQANARVPADGRPVLLKAAAMMRADPSFTAKLEASLAGEEPGATWRNEMAAMSARIASVEAAVLRKTPVSRALSAAVQDMVADGGHAPAEPSPKPAAAVVQSVDW